MGGPATVRDVPDMYRRLALVSRELETLGLQHKRVPEQLLTAMAGKDVAPLRTLANVLEPVKEYKRHFQGMFYTPQTPLNRLVDAAPAESEEARQFGAAVDALLAGRPAGTTPLPLDAPARVAVQATLARWAANDKLLRPLLTTTPTLTEYAPLSAYLSALATLALERLQQMEKSQVPSAAWLCAATLRPRTWAVSTIARISSGVIARPRPPLTFDSTPPVAANFMTRAPSATCARTARRQSSGPSHRLT
jgi:hexosaminidase